MNHLGNPVHHLSPGEHMRARLHELGNGLAVARTFDDEIGDQRHALRVIELDSALKFERKKARGMRLDIAAGTAVRFEPGQAREVTLVALAGKRTVYGFRQEIMGKL